MSPRPRPVVDESSQAYWEGAARGELVLAACSSCGVISHPPDIDCSACHSSDPRLQPASVPGTGSVCSWTVLHQAPLPGFEQEVPFVLVDVALDGTEDIRLIGRLVGPGGARLTLGARVSLAFEDLGDGVAVPAFCLDGAA